MTLPASGFTPRRDWRDDAACIGMPIEVFYGTLDEPLSLHETLFAQRICQACPVLMDCASTSLAEEEPHGVWAASTPRQRQKLLRDNGGNAERSAKRLVQITLNADCENAP